MIRECNVVTCPPPPPPPPTPCAASLLIDTCRVQVIAQFGSNPCNTICGRLNKARCLDTLARGSYLHWEIQRRLGYFGPDRPVLGLHGTGAMDAQ